MLESMSLSATERTAGITAVPIIRGWTFKEGPVTELLVDSPAAAKADTPL